MVQWLLGAGVLQLASAASLGWLIALDRADPAKLKMIGIKVPRRLLQLHLDQVMMGVILLAVATAFPDIPDWTAIALLIGTTLNPLLFLPLAFAPKLDEALGYRVISVGSFVASTIGFVGLAIWFLFLR
ncbi:MAG: hypothetical protein J7513_17510 [Solirubrobacteraceae bacterium]|nr:hypothetical protein [Solirubrobacteraceae bacterium]